MRKKDWQQSKKILRLRPKHRFLKKRLIESPQMKKLRALRKKDWL